MKRVFLALATALLISGCLSVPGKKVVAVSYDPGDIQRVEKSKAYHWSLPSSSEINPYNNQDLYLSLVKSQIDDQLAKKGFKQVPAGGDLEVSFLVLYKQGATTAVVDQYFGTNRAPERRIVHVLKEVPVSPNYEIGTLIVDAEDAHDHESLWRGAVSSKIDRNKSFESQKAHIDTAVALVLRDFPASRK